MPVVLIHPVSMCTDSSGLVMPCYQGWPLFSSYLIGPSHSSQEGRNLPHHQNKPSTCPVLFPNNCTQIHMCATQSVYPLANAWETRQPIYDPSLTREVISRDERNKNSRYCVESSLWPRDPSETTTKSLYSLCLVKREITWAQGPDEETADTLP